MKIALVLVILIVGTASAEAGWFWSKPKVKAKVAKVEDHAHANQGQPETPTQVDEKPKEPQTYRIISGGTNKVTMAVYNADTRELKVGAGFTQEQVIIRLISIVVSSSKLFLTKQSIYSKQTEMLLEKIQILREREMELKAQKLEYLEDSYEINKALKNLAKKTREWESAEMRK